MGGWRSFAIGTAVVCTVATAIVLIDPRLRPVSGQSQLQVTLETASSLIALLASFLALGRLRRRGCLTDLVLACGLGVVALSNAFYAIVAVFVTFPGASIWAWSSVSSRAVGSIIFCAAAFIPDRDIRRLGRTYVTAAALVVGSSLALAVLLTGVFAPKLPVGVTAATPPVLHIDPALVVLESLTAVACGVAVVGYLGRRRRTGSEFFGWLAIAAVFAAASHVNYVLYPSMYVGLISVGDLFRLCFYMVLLAGSMREIRSYWIALSETMVTSERQRIASDLHDGLAQELAYLVRNLKSLDGSVDQETVDGLYRATERARLESRLAISRLAVLDQRTMEDELAEAATEAARRFGIALELDMHPGIQLPAGHGHVLVRIACEAVTNAARHSGASHISLSLRRQGSRVRLRICDTGCGFDPTGPAAGFGLISMRERAASVGGELSISSAPGFGTEVEVVL